jgi:hypothetical protein
MLRRPKIDVNRATSIGGRTCNRNKAFAVAQIPSPSATVRKRKAIDLTAVAITSRRE